MANINENNVPRREKEKLRTMVNGKINGLFYYYLDGGLLATIVDDKGIPLPKGPVDNTSILGTTDAIQNIAYVPFLNIDADHLYRVRFDTERYGTVFDYSQGPGPTSHSDNLPFVFRVNMERDNLLSTKLVEGKLWDNRPRRPAIGTKQDYKYESRLYNYPYTTVVFQSNIFDQYEVVPHLMMNPYYATNSVELHAAMAVNPGGNFYVNCPGYKGDHIGITERSFSSSSMDIPNTSSAYSNYMSSQKARTAVSTAAGIGLGAISVAGGIATANPVAIAGGLVSIGSTVANNLATKTDMRSTPNSLKSMGGDIMSRLAGTGIDTKNKPFVAVYNKTIGIHDKIVLGDFFHMYGYKINAIRDISKDLRTRHYYNYIKTIGCNVKGNGVPKKHLAKIKQIMDTGTTLWHVDRNGGLFCDYQFDNTEV